MPPLRALVTGGARGLGEAVGARLVRDGGDVALVDVASEVMATAERVAGVRPDAVVVPLVADVSDERFVEGAVAQAVERLGGLDLLVNNAGIGGSTSELVETTVADIRRVLEVNLLGAFFVARAVAQVMVAQGTGGSIVNIGSILGQQGVAGAAAYCASKAGIALLTHCLALELAPHGIRVNTIAPGNMSTEMNWAYLRELAELSGTSFEEEVERVRASVPLRRLGTGEDVAGAVAWLVSEDAAYVTGQTIGVSGGVALT